MNLCVTVTGSSIKLAVSLPIVYMGLMTFASCFASFHDYCWQRGRQRGVHIKHKLTSWLAYQFPDHGELQMAPLNLFHLHPVDIGHKLRILALIVLHSLSWHKYNN